MQSRAPGAPFAATTLDSPAPVLSCVNNLAELVVGAGRPVFLVALVVDLRGSDDRAVDAVEGGSIEVTSFAVEGHRLDELTREFLSSEMILVMRIVGSSSRIAQPKKSANSFGSTSDVPVTNTGSGAIVASMAGRSPELNASR